MLVNRKLLITSLILMSTATLCSQAIASGNERLESLLKMDITELVEISVFMPSRKLERRFDAPAAIYVITEEDIRRSGLVRIPEILRMVPGLHVGSIDANTWAISSRSDMSRFSNSMLVLLDGRTLYNPLFAGVYWDVQDTYIKDIDRIEIIRGPGGSLWGSNAFDGIINIITKSAEKTDYTNIYVGVGQGAIEHDGGIRHGSQINPTLYSRVYAKNYKTDQGKYLDSQKSTNAGFFAEGDDAFDDGENTQAGFRLDWKPDEQSSVSFQGDTYDGEFNTIRTGVPHENPVNAAGKNIVTKWDKQINKRSSTSLQFFLDITKREDILFEEEREVFDLDFQHTLSLESNLLTWGLGFRRTEDDTMRMPTGSFELNPSGLSYTTYSAFIQDRIEILSNELFFTFGTKFEENELTGGEIQPSARLLWKIDSEQTFWSSVTRAVRIPARADLHAQLNFGGPPIIISDSYAQAESVVATEIGYRSQAINNTLLDIAVFNHNYSDHNSGTIKLDQTYGLEAVVNHEVNSKWRLETSYTWHKGTVQDNGFTETNNRIPRQSINVRSLLDIASNWEFDTYVFYREALNLNGLDFEDYVRVDIRVGWNPNHDIRTSFTITNLLDDEHVESSDPQRVNTSIGRGLLLNVSYDFN